MKITTRVALLFIVYAFVLLTAVGALAYIRGRDALSAAVISGLQATSLEKRSALSGWIEEKRGDITRLATDPAIVSETAALVDAPAGSPEAGSAHDQLVEQLASEVRGEEFFEIMILDPRSGQVIASTNPADEGKFQEDRPFFINGKIGVNVQSLYYSIDLQGPAMTASAPLHEASRGLLAVIAARLDLAEINSIITRRTGLYQTDEAFLVNTSHLFVTQPRFISNPAVLQRGVYSEAVNTCLKRQSGALHTRDYRNVAVFSVYRWLPEQNLCLITKIDQAEALAPSEKFGAQVLAFSAIALLIASLLAIGLSHSITRPILALKSTVQRFGQGDRSMRMPERLHDELGELAHEFNSMATAITTQEAQLRNHAETLEEKIQERTQALQIENQRFARFIDSNIVGIVITDITGKVEQANDYYLNILGVSRADLAGGTVDWRQSTPPEWLPYDESALREMQAEGVCKPYEKEYQRTDGTRVPVYQAAALLPGPEQQIAAFVVDMTRLKETEAELKESEKRFRTAFMTSPDAITITRLEDGKYALVNAGFTSMWGYSEAEALGKTSMELGLWDNAKDRQSFVEAVNKTDVAHNLEVRLRRRNGEAVDCLVSSARMEMDGGMYLLSVTRDFTERKRSQEALARYAEELKRSNAELEQFAYVASHDLQEPLRMVASYTQLLERRYRDRLDPEANEFIGYAVDGASRMQLLINDLLSYSRVSTRARPFSRVDANTILGEVLADLKQAIRDTHGVVTNDELPEITGDAIQLRQLFQNLIGNALKFHGSEAPRIHVSAAQDGGMWRFGISDNGIGIDPQFADRIFVIFQRLHTRQDYPGSGIGLAICKKIVERHGGRIWVDSREGAGSTFYFSLPAAPRTRDSESQ